MEARKRAQVETLRDDQKDCMGDVSAEAAPARTPLSMAARWAGALSNMMGHVVRAQTLSGDQYEGVLASLSESSGGVEVLLRWARRLHEPRSGVARIRREDFRESLHIGAHELAQIVVRDVAVAGDDGPRAATAAAHRSLCTDAEIGSGGGGGASEKGGVRPLERWMPETDISADLVLDEHGDGRRTGWSAEDMIRVNAIKFGVTSTYQESLYMTPVNIDPSSAADRKLLERAIEMERAILRDSARNARNSTAPRRHGANEDVDDDDLYSSVRRPVQEARDTGADGSASGKPAPKTAREIAHGERRTGADAPMVPAIETTDAVVPAAAGSAKCAIPEPRGQHTTVPAADASAAHAEMPADATVAAASTAPTAAADGAAAAGGATKATLIKLNPNAEPYIPQQSLQSAVRAGAAWSREPYACAWLMAALPAQPGPMAGHPAVVNYECVHRVVCWPCIAQTLLTHMPTAVATSPRRS